MLHGNNIFLRVAFLLALFSCPAVAQEDGAVADERARGDLVGGPHRGVGVIDDHLESLGVRRNITARCPHFGLIPQMVASSLLVLTTGQIGWARPDQLDLPIDEAPAEPF